MILEDTQMNNDCQAENNEESLRHWDQAIADADSKLKAARKNVCRLESALASFKRNRELRRPWPGSKPAGTESVPAKG
jgi:hypothetical protein